MPFSLLDDLRLVSTLEIERQAKTVDGRGRTVCETGPRETILGSVQPLSPRERELLPEADRESEALALFTRHPGLDTRTRVFHRGSVYRVSAVEPWETPRGTYCRAVLIRESLP